MFFSHVSENDEASFKAAHNWESSLFKSIKALQISDNAVEAEEPSRNNADKRRKDLKGVLPSIRFQ